MRYNHKTQSKSIEMNTIKIDTQEWATEDLEVTKFRNGEDIPLVKDNDEWIHMDSAAYCITPHGNYLYNWYAVNDPRGLAPTGFHVPSDDEWQQLVDYCGGNEKAGNLLKSTKKWNGTGPVKGFNAIPSGYRSYDDGYFNFQGYNGSWWSSSPNGLGAWYRSLGSGSSSVYRGYRNARDGFSVRCLKNL